MMNFKRLFSLFIAASLSFSMFTKKAESILADEEVLEEISNDESQSEDLSISTEASDSEEEEIKEDNKEIDESEEVIEIEEDEEIVVENEGNDFDHAILLGLGESESFYLNSSQKTMYFKFYADNKTYSFKTTGRAFLSGKLYDQNRNEIVNCDMTKDYYNFRIEKEFNTSGWCYLVVEIDDSTSYFNFNVIVNLVERGTCGTDAYWCIEGDTLTISGTGKMRNYWYNQAPWVGRSVKNINIESGITSIGENSFNNMGTLDSFVLKNTVTNIGKDAFGDGTVIKKLNYVGMKSDWKKISFQDDTSYPTYACDQLILNGAPEKMSVVLDESRSVTTIKSRYNEKVTFKVVPKYTDPTDYSYEWLRNWTTTPIPGATTNTYSLTVGMNVESYTCTITNIYNKQLKVCCTAMPNLTWKIQYPYSMESFEVNTYHTLKVPLTNESDTTSLTYQWYLYNSETKQKTPVQNATSDTLRIYMDQNKEYLCEVSDSYGFTYTAQFTLTIKKPWELKYTYIDREIGPNEDIGLCPVFIDEYYQLIPAPAGLSYKWIIDGETVGQSKTYTLRNVANKTNVRCEITDSNGTKAFVNFQVNIRRTWSLPERYETVKVPLHGNVNLTPKVDNPDGTKLTYKWIDYTEQSKTLSLTNVTRTSTLLMFVHDDYGNEESVWFRVEVDKGWTLKDTYEESYVPYNGYYTASVSVEPNPCSIPLTYKWYKNGQIVSTITGPATMIHYIRENVTYKCVVEDQYGNQETKEFVFKIKPSWKVLNNDINIYVSEGSNVKLEVPFKEDSDTSNLTYSWKEFFSSYVAYTTQNVYLKNVRDYHEYYCTVKDIYGNEEYVAFHVFVGDRWENDRYPTQRLYTVKKGDSLTLEAPYFGFEENNGTTYYCSISFPDSNTTDSTTRIEMNEDHTIVNLSNISEKVRIYWDAQSKWGTHRDTEIDIQIADEILVDYRNSQRIHYAHKGDDVTLECKFMEGSNLEDVKVQWHSPDEQKTGFLSSLKNPDYDISEDGKSLTFHNVQKTDYIYAELYISNQLLFRLNFDLIVTDKAIPKLSLEDQNFTFNGNVPEVKGPVEENGTGNVRILYYTDIQCTKIAGKESGASFLGAPTKVGTYYMVAVDDGDDDHVSAYSNVAKLEILQPVSTSTIDGYSMTLSGDIVFNVHAFIEDKFASDPDAYLVLKNGTQEIRAYIRDAKQSIEDNKVRYSFACPLPVKDVATKYHIQIVNSKKEFKELAIHSGDDYLYQVRNRFPGRDIAIIARTLETYAYYAQIYFNYQLDSLPSTHARLTTYHPNENYAYELADNNDAVEFVGAKLLLKHKPGLKLYFKGTSTLTLNGKKVKLQKEGKYDVLIFNEISDIFEKYTIKTTDFSLKYGVISYLNKAFEIGNENPDLYNLARAMMMYYSLF